MSIGTSGRIVIEVDPNLKKSLYSALAKEGLSLKEWFQKGAYAYLDRTSPLHLNLKKQKNKGEALPSQNTQKNLK